MRNSMKPTRPANLLNAAFASFSVCVAVSWPWAIPASTWSLASPDDPKPPISNTIATPRHSTHTIISNGVRPSRNSTNGLKYGGNALGATAFCRITLSMTILIGQGRTSGVISDMPKSANLALYR